MGMDLRSEKSKGLGLSGTESAIPNRESGNSESGESNRAIPWSRLTLIGCDSDWRF